MNFENFKKMCSLGFRFSIIRFSETWSDDLDNFTRDLCNYFITYREMSDRKGGGVFVYVHNSLNFKTRPDLSIGIEHAESVTLEVLSEKTCKAIENILDRPPDEHFKPFQNFLKTFLLNTKILTKIFKLQEISIST